MESFDGPYDVLLELAQERKVEISQVSLAALTDSFLNRVRRESIEPELLADFLVVASTLLLFKLNELLPNLTEKEEEEIAELTDRLRIYQLYREQATTWRERWQQSPLMPGPEHLVVNLQEQTHLNITATDLATAIVLVREQLPEPIDKRRHLRPHGRSLKECQKLLKQRITQTQAATFKDVVAGEDRETQAVSFLALMQLCRQKELSLVQADPFDVIHIATP